MLAPMRVELQPIIDQLELQEDGDDTRYRGHAGDVEVVALLTNIGMGPGADAARRMLELDIDWVMVVGVAGGVDKTITIGEVIVPETVVDRATGNSYRPHSVGDITPRGIVSCGDELITDPTIIGQMEKDGVRAVEMESAAVGPVCEDAGVPWSVFRGISDFADAGLVDDELFAMTRPDGSADPDAMKRLLADPKRAKILQQLGHDTMLATTNVAAAAIRACAMVPKQ